MRIVEYSAVSGETVRDLMKYVNQCINDKGWQPFGSVFENDNSLIQPLVKYEEEKTNEEPTKFVARFKFKDGYFEELEEEKIDEHS